MSEAAAPAEAAAPETGDLDSLWCFHHIEPMPEAEAIRPVSWIASSYKDYRAFPEPVQDAMGFALFRAQQGAKHDDAKPLTGFGGAGVLEIVADHDGDTFRADIELIRCRLKVAEAD